MPGSRPKTKPVPDAAGLTVESSAEDVCREFLRLLENGERFEARQLLTDQAQLATERANLELDAPGGGAMTFEVSGARYATGERQIALVDCHFRDPVDPDARMTLTWTMRRQENGWKIAGMLVDPGGGALDLLSFENASDLARIHQSVDGDAQNLPERTATPGQPIYR